MEDLKALTQQIEYLFIKTIINGLEGGTMTIPQAKQYAQEFLKLEPFTSEDDAHQKVNGIFEKHPEFGEVKKYVDLYDKERASEQKVSTIKQLIKDNNIDEALNVAKG